MRRIDKFLTTIWIAAAVLSATVACSNNKSYPEIPGGFGEAGPVLANGNHASLSPDGRYLAFHSMKGDTTQNLYVLDLDSGSERRLYHDETMHAQEPRWSPDGKSVAFVGGPNYDLGSFSLFTVKANGTDLRKLTTGHNGLLKSPGWSPDGTRISFAVRNPAELTAHTFSVRAGGDGVLRHTEREGMHQHPRWNPITGQLLISYRQMTEDQQLIGDLYLIEAGETREDGQRLTHTESPEFMMAWSPDARLVLNVQFVPDSGQYNIFGLDPATGAEINLSDSPEVNEFFPEFSPDCRFVYHDNHPKGEGREKGIVRRAVHIDTILKRINHQNPSTK